MNSNNFEVFIKIIYECYRKYWDNWYRDLKQLTPASLSIKISEADSGYEINTDTIHINIWEGDFCDIVDRNQLQIEEDFSEMKPHEWPVWFPDLIHEMIHEYQFKVKPEPSQSGQILYNNYNRLYPSKGHGIDFFTVFEIVSQSLNMSAEELVCAIPESPFYMRI
jgi:hypothetical protein